MDVLPDFPAILLGQEAVKNLNMLLSPPNPLERDVRSLSGALGFSRDEVLYINQKSYPFVYMLDQWLKRENESATLKVIHKNLLELRRMDAAEIVENVVKQLSDRDPKEIKQILEQHKHQLKRSSSTTTLCTAPNSSSFPIKYECKQQNSERFHAPGSVIDVNGYGRDWRKVPSDAPNVFTVYFPENEKHLRNIRRFIKQLRKNGIDATADMFESTESSADRGFYIYSKLIQAEYVFVVCSRMFALYEHEKDHVNQETSERVKEISFIMKLILDDIFDKGGVNAKYIPVLLPKSTEEHVPFILKGSTLYNMPSDYDDLKRRVFKIEKYKLEPMPKNRPELTPIRIGNGLNLLKMSLTK